MLGPPGVVRGRRPVGGALDVAVEGLPELAGPVAAPPVSPVLVHLVVERMVHLRRERPARSAARGEPAAALRAARSAARDEPAAALCAALSRFLKFCVGKTTMFSFFPKGHFNGTQQLT